jgi:hypothetical protein
MTKAPATQRFRDCQEVRYPITSAPVTDREAPADRRLGGYGIAPRVSPKKINSLQYRPNLPKTPPKNTILSGHEGIWCIGRAYLRLGRCPPHAPSGVIGLPES